MQMGWLVLLPPIVVLVLGFVTRRVIFSLICGILVAATIACQGNIFQALKMAGGYLYTNVEIGNYTSWDTFWECKNSFIAIFLCILGAIVTLIGHSGGAYAYGKIVKRRLKDARSAQTASLLLSQALFVDDYFSSLTVGSVMHPLTDEFKVPRVKLAFLVDAMAAPLTILVPISSWVAAIIGWLSENGVSAVIQSNTLINADPFTIYASIIPFIFYSFIIIFASWFIVRRNISFGLMHRYECIAKDTGNLFGGKPPQGHAVRTVHDRLKDSSSITDFILPVAILLVSVVGAIQYSGQSWLFGSQSSIIDAFRSANPFIALLIAGVITIGICIPFYVCRKKLLIQEIPQALWDGITIMSSAIIILMLAWTLGDILRNDLKTGEYLAQLMVGNVPLFFLPVMFFGVSLITSFALGSSWGASAIMFPIAIPMVIKLLGLSAPVTIDQVSLLLPVLGAILSGAIAGDHISPISDTTIMSSTSTGAYHISHVQTQFGYAWPIVLCVALAFISAGLLASYGMKMMLIVSIPIGIISSALLLSLLNTKSRS